MVSRPLPWAAAAAPHPPRTTHALQLCLISGGWPGRQVATKTAAGRSRISGEICRPVSLKSSRDKTQVAIKSIISAGVALVMPPLLCALSPHLVMASASCPDINSCLPPPSSGALACPPPQANGLQCRYIRANICQGAHHTGKYPLHAPKRRM